MNFYVTSAAASRLAALIQKNYGLGVMIEVPEDGGLHIETMFMLGQKDAIMIDAEPPIFTTLHTLRKLRNSSIDFDQMKDEFIIRLH